MSEEVVLLEVSGRVALITLNRPKAMNALNSAVVDGMNTAIDSVLWDEAIRAVVVTGSGSAFCAGADLKEVVGAQVPPGEPDFLDKAGAMMARLATLPKPVIAALNGTTMAGGLELALCADLILAVDTARIGDAHANFGVFPGAGGAALLPRRIPLHAAMYLLYTGKTLPAARLMELGLVCEVHPADGLRAAALELAQTIADKSPSSLRRMKEVARAAADKRGSDALLHEQVHLRQHLRSADFQEGIRAFSEKRAPQFTGR